MDGKKIAYLNEWYINIINEYKIAHGIVTGHERLLDTTFISTSEIKDVKANIETGEVIIITRNTEYHCKMEDCNLEQMDKELYPEIVANAAQFQKSKYFEQPDNSILVVVSDTKGYYFDALVCKIGGVQYKGSMHVHIGMLQDSCIMNFWNVADSIDDETLLWKIDLRYFPHAKHLESYEWCNEGLDVYIENSGLNEVYFSTQDGVFEIKPSVRVLVAPKNALSEGNIPFLSRSDLYPAMVFDIDNKKE